MAATLIGKQSGSGATITTSSGTTVTGRTLVICISWGNGVTASNVRDSKGNTYTQAGSNQTNAGTSHQKALYYCQNATGGTGHTASVDFSGGTPDGTVYLIEVPNTLASSFDKTAQGRPSSPSFGLQIPSAGSFTQASETIVEILGLDSSGTVTYTSSDMTVIASETDGNLYWTSAVLTKDIASTSAFTGTLTAPSSGDCAAVAASFMLSGGSSSATALPGVGAITVNGRQVSTSAFQNVRIRQVLVNDGGQPVGNAANITLLVWYGGVCHGAPDVSLNGLTTDADGTTSWSIATGTLGYQDKIFYVAQDSASFSNYTCARLTPSYE